jgi:hypothetical protein
LRAWLTQSTVAAAGRKGLTTIGGDKWGRSLVIGRVQGPNKRPLPAKPVLVRIMQA